MVVPQPRNHYGSAKRMGKLQIVDKINNKLKQLKLMSKALRKDFIVVELIRILCYFMVF